jgi:CBS domain-containing protein
MKARDVMVTSVVIVPPNMLVKDVAKLMVQRRISAVPVVDESDKLVGLVSEGDLVRRTELGTEVQRAPWLTFFMGPNKLAAEYVKAHGRKVADVMTRAVITANPGTPLQEIAALMEKNSIKRVPIVTKGQLVGLVTRANLVQAVATAGRTLATQPSDSAIRQSLLEHLKKQPWAHTSLVNVIVQDGIVDLWGMAVSDTEKQAFRVAAEGIPGVKAVHDDFVRSLGA